MKTLFILLLLFTLSCEKIDSGSSSGSAESQTPAASTNSTIPGGTTTTPPTPTTPGTPSSTDTWTEEFMDLINNHRTSIGLRALILNDGMIEIVLQHSQNMANGSVAFGHTGFSSRCSASYDVLGGGNWCGENVAMGQKTPQAAFTAWMNSPGHRANIESSKATHTGFAYARSSSGTYYWTQNFIQRSFHTILTKEDFHKIFTLNEYGRINCPYLFRSTYEISNRGFIVSLSFSFRSGS